MELHRYMTSASGWTEVDADYSPDTQAPSPFLWTEVTHMTRDDEPELARLLAVESELLAYFLETDASFVTTDSNALFQLATRTARVEAETLHYSSLLISMTSGGLIIAESGDSGIGAATRARIACHREPSDPWNMLSLLLDEYADSYLPVMEAVEDQAISMEEHLSTAPLSQSQLSTLFRMRRQLMLLQRIIDPVSNLVARLDHTERLPNSGQAADFRAARDELHRLESRVEGAWQVVTSVVEMSNLLEQQRQGNASRQLAAWAAIVAVPTAIAGIFGMNFNRMPGLDTENGPWIALAVMAIACACLYWRFRRIGWL